MREQEIVEGIADIVGDDVVTDAYFNGADVLLSAFEERLGENSWAMFKALLDANKLDAADTMLILGSTKI